MGLLFLGNNFGVLGASAGLGAGQGFAVGLEQNVFTGATRTAAESARDTYATANASWLTTYNDDTALNIRLEFTSGTDQVAVYQTRNTAGDGWVDNQSFQAIKGDTGTPGSGGMVSDVQFDGDKITVTYSDSTTDLSLIHISEPTRPY